jgi:hypothetical protein
LEPTDELRRLEEQAAETGMKLAIERLNGHWRAGFVVANCNGDCVFALHAVAPDEDTAVQKLADIVARQVATQRR